MDLRLSLWIGYVIHAFIAVPMDLFLHRASKNKDTPKLRIFGVVNCFNMIWALVDYWAHTWFFGLHIQSLFLYNSYCLYKFYVCIVVYYYIRDIEDEEEEQAAARTLTEEELKDFEEGLAFKGELDVATKDLMEKVQYQRYKREDYEIRMDKLELDLENPLGKGMYGIVYRGSLKRGDGQDKPVAVKTFESGIMDANCFKALLYELKVMTYLGQHPNVISLVGAVTSEIKTRRLHMVIEFCPFGNVLENLRASRGLFVNTVINGEIQFDQGTGRLVNEEDGLSTIELIRWSQEIASGMEYLGDMKVVHGDLAARNLLLAEGKRIKIADFGLARQLYQYSVYVKRQNSPLPWRWLAIESLTDMNFSTKSDVWAYSVVLHELFTLGKAPYSVQQFTLEFVEKLREGMRLEQPDFCPDSVYKKMQECWVENPDERPSFHDLSLFFKLVLAKAEVEHTCLAKYVLIGIMESEKEVKINK
ncbi:Vascular endothelial growth factor receptor 1 [Orchesella cincta]|uniref:Vascular endothelial growth factor receptor 1 n=1 Tax=Orchesella cincta TaxID=48709 RepID=A0A1D2MEP8_ORCCI|nr:Vascular endothelial growth factor receptor 1 [Orchesella cincta]